MGCQESKIFIVMTVLGKEYPETRPRPTVGTSEQCMIVGELDDLLQRQVAV